MYKFFILIFIITFGVLSFYISNAEDINYPIYYGTKKCEINEGFSLKNYKIYPSYSDISENKSYIYKGDLYVNGELFNNNIDTLFFEFDGNVFYSITQDDKKLIYNNDKLLITVDYYDFRNAYYNKEIGRYYIGVNLDSTDYIFSNGELIKYDDFKWFKRYYSNDKKTYIDTYRNSNFGEVIHSNLGAILELSPYLYINHIDIYDDNYAISLINHKKNTQTFIINSQEYDFNNVVSIQYSPNGKNLFFVTQNENTYDFYKNNEKILTFEGRILNDIIFDFKNDDEYEVKLTNWSDHALIKNGEIIASYEDKIQTKLDLLKDNGDHFIITRDKNIGKDTLYINGKKILQASSIDERFINSGIGTFSLFSNSVQDSQYYTYVRIDNEYYLFVNGFLVYDMYDYLRLEEGLNKFNFASLSSRGNISCTDITKLYHNLGYTREYLEEFLLKILSLSSDKKEIVINRINILLDSKILSRNKKEILKMIKNNLDKQFIY